MEEYVTFSPKELIIERTNGFKATIHFKGLWSPIVFCELSEPEKLPITTKHNVFPLEYNRERFYEIEFRDNGQNSFPQNISFTLGAPLMWQWKHIGILYVPVKFVNK